MPTAKWLTVTVRRSLQRLRPLLNWIEQRTVREMVEIIVAVCDQGRLTANATVATEKTGGR
jgi:hypothetical protein